MSGEVDQATGLRTLFVRLIREELGLHEQLALPLAERLVCGLRRECGGRALRIPAATAAERYQAIRDAHAIGTPIRAIGAALGVDRSTVYRALRGGSPGADWGTNISKK